MNKFTDTEILKFAKQNLIFTRDNFGELELSRVLCDVHDVIGNVGYACGNVGYVYGKVGYAHSYVVGKGE